MAPPPAVLAAAGATGQAVCGHGGVALVLCLLCLCPLVPVAQWASPASNPFRLRLPGLGGHWLSLSMLSPSQPLFPGWRLGLGAVERSPCEAEGLLLGVGDGGAGDMLAGVRRSPGWACAQGGSGTEAGQGSQYSGLCMVVEGSAASLVWMATVPTGPTRRCVLLSCLELRPASAFPCRPRHLKLELACPEFSAFFLAANVTSTRLWLEPGSVPVCLPSLPHGPSPPSPCPRWAVSGTVGLWAAVGLPSGAD